MRTRLEGSNTLGKVGLGLGIASSALVFGMGLCALTGLQGGWLRGPLATVLFVCGGSSAFLGFLGLLSGVGGLLGSGERKAIAIIGALLGLLGMCMFFGFLALMQPG